VVAVGEGEKETAPVATKAMVLKAHLEGHLDGGRSVIGEKDPAQPRRGQGDEAFGQFDGPFVAEVAEDAVSHLLRLTAEGLVEVLVAVAEEVDPPGGDGVETAPPLDVVEPDAPAAVDDKGRVGLVVFHLRTGVPDSGPIAALKVVDAHG